ncbi:MAG TPA: SIMPL domain-containing protein [Terriglobales bacterium]|nr:SIMPL domain-containing protein [Terriglobales bacterium]
MTSKLAVLFAVMLVLAGIAVAQEHPAVTAQPNTIYVGADGKYETAPDTALVQFNISAQEETAKAAYDRASRAAEQIRQILRSNGIEPKTAEIGFFSLDPVYDYRSPKRKLIAYRVNSSVSLKLKNFSKVAPIVSQISDLDVTANQNVSYTLENMDAAKLRATEDAYQRAREEAATVARAAQRTLGELSYASVDTFEQVRVVAAPMMRQAMGAAMAAAPAPTEQFTPQKITVTAHVNALFTMR